MRAFRLARQRIGADQELIGLGAGNLGAAFTGSYPVTGGFARSVVNFDAGAETPAGGAFTALGLLFASLFLTPLVHYLPTATLAATVIGVFLIPVFYYVVERIGGKKPNPEAAGASQNPSVQVAGHKEGHHA